MRYKLNENKELIKVMEEKDNTKAVVFVGSTQAVKDVQKRLMGCGARFKKKEPENKTDNVAEFNVIFRNLKDAVKFKDEMDGDSISTFISGYTAKRKKSSFPKGIEKESDLFKNFKL